MRWLFQSLVAGSGIIILLGAWIALSWSGLLVKSRSVEDHAAFLAPHMRVHMPTGEGPFPSVLMFHGCGSAEASQNDWAEYLSDHGYGAIIVDSLTPRGIGRVAALGTVCTALQLPGRERAGDVIAAIHHAHTLEGVDADNLFLAGWSHGGWAIMDLMTLDPGALDAPNLRDVPGDMLEGVRGAVLVYPYSGFPARSRSREWQTKLPVIAFAGTADTVANPAHTQAAFHVQREAGAEIQFEMFDGATHDFDVNVDEFLHQGSFDERATEDMRALTLDFLDQHSSND